MIASLGQILVRRLLSYEGVRLLLRWIAIAGWVVWCC